MKKPNKSKFKKSLKILSTIKGDAPSKDQLKSLHSIVAYIAYLNNTSKDKGPLLFICGDGNEGLTYTLSGTENGVIAMIAALILHDPDICKNIVDALNLANDVAEMDVIEKKSKNNHDTDV